MRILRSAPMFRSCVHSPKEHFSPLPVDALNLPEMWEFGAYIVCLGMPVTCGSNVSSLMHYVFAATDLKSFAAGILRTLKPWRTGSYESRNYK